jgi:D-alanyl-D-alanine carboxypeptidase
MSPGVISKESGRASTGRRRRRIAITAAAVLVLLTAACGGQAPGTAGTLPTPASEASPPAASSASPSGLKPIDQANLQALVDKTMKERLVPGAMVLLRGPQGEFMAPYGTTELGKQSPPSVDTHVRIASISKSMTAASILLMAQEGKLALTDPISKYVSDVPNGDKITLSLLLQMRSGLYNYTEDPRLAAGIDGNHKKVWKPKELLSMAFSHPPNFAPGATYEYNNTNFALLGLVAEKVDGMPLATVVKERVFVPLGMDDSYIPAPDDTSLPAPYSHGYLYGSSSVALVGEPPYSPKLQAAARAGTLLPKDYTGVNHSFAQAAGGVISTADDSATWIKALVAGRVLNPAYQRRWLDSVKPEDPSKPEGQKYGYGIAQLSWGPNTIYFHGGETPGYNSKISYDPANDMTLIVWTNLPVSLGDQQQTANTLWVRVLDHIYKVSPLETSP